MLYECQSLSNILLTHGHFLDFKTFSGSKENNDLKVPEKMNVDQNYQNFKKNYFLNGIP